MPLFERWDVQKKPLSLLCILYWESFCLRFMLWHLVLLLPPHTRRQREGRAAGFVINNSVLERESETLLWGCSAPLRRAAAPIPKFIQRSFLKWVTIDKDRFRQMDAFILKLNVAAVLISVLQKYWKDKKKSNVKTKLSLLWDTQFYLRKQTNKKLTPPGLFSYYFLLKLPNLMNF